jgi:hypothetical protein
MAERERERARPLWAAAARLIQAQPHDAYTRTEGQRALRIALDHPRQVPADWTLNPCVMQPVAGCIYAILACAVETPPDLKSCIDTVVAGADMLVTERRNWATVLILLQHMTFAPGLIFRPEPRHLLVCSPLSSPIYHEIGSPLALMSTVSLAMMCYFDVPYVCPAMSKLVRSLGMLNHDRPLHLWAGDDFALRALMSLMTLYGYEFNGIGVPRLFDDHLVKMLLLDPSEHDVHAYLRRTYEEAQHGAYVFSGTPAARTVRLMSQMAQLVVDATSNINDLSPEKSVVLVRNCYGPININDTRPPIFDVLCEKLVTLNPQTATLLCCWSPGTLVLTPRSVFHTAISLWLSRRAHLAGVAPSMALWKPLFMALPVEFDRCACREYTPLAMHDRDAPVEVLVAYKYASAAWGSNARKRQLYTLLTARTVITSMDGENLQSWMRAIDKFRATALSIAETATPHLCIRQASAVRCMLADVPNLMRAAGTQEVQPWLQDLMMCPAFCLGSAADHQSPAIQQAVARVERVRIIDDVALQDGTGAPVRFRDMPADAMPAPEPAQPVETVSPNFVAMYSEERRAVVRQYIANGDDDNDRVPTTGTPRRRGGVLVRDNDDGGGEAPMELDPPAEAVGGVLPSPPMMAPLSAGQAARRRADQPLPPLQDPHDSDNDAAADAAAYDIDNDAAAGAARAALAPEDATIAALTRRCDALEEELQASREEMRDLAQVMNDYEVAMRVLRERVDALEQARQADAAMYTDMQRLVNTSRDMRAQVQEQGRRQTARFEEVTREVEDRCDRAVARCISLTGEHLAKASDLVTPIGNEFDAFVEDTTRQLEHLYDVTRPLTQRPRAESSVARERLPAPVHGRSAVDGRQRRGNIVWETLTPVAHADAAGRAAVAFGEPLVTLPARARQPASPAHDDASLDEPRPRTAGPPLPPGVLDQPPPLVAAGARRPEQDSPEPATAPPVTAVVPPQSSRQRVPAAALPAVVVSDEVRTAYETWARQGPLPGVWEDATRALKRMEHPTMSFAEMFQQAQRSPAPDDRLCIGALALARWCIRRDEDRDAYDVVQTGSSPTTATALFVHECAVSVHSYAHCGLRALDDDDDLHPSAGVLFSSALRLPTCVPPPGMVARLMTACGDNAVMPLRLVHAALYEQPTLQLKFKWLGDVALGDSLCRWYCAMFVAAATHPLQDVHDALNGTPHQSILAPALFAGVPSSQLRLTATARTYIAQLCVDGRPANPPEVLPQPPPDAELLPWCIQNYTMAGPIDWTVSRLPSASLFGDEGPVLHDLSTTVQIGQLFRRREDVNFVCVDRTQLQRALTTMPRQVIAVVHWIRRQSRDRALEAYQGLSRAVETTGVLTPELIAPLQAMISVTPREAAQLETLCEHAFRHGATLLASLHVVARMLGEQRYVYQAVLDSNPDLPRARWLASALFCVFPLRYTSRLTVSTGLYPQFLLPPDQIAAEHTVWTATVRLDPCLVPLLLESCLPGTSGEERTALVHYAAASFDQAVHQLRMTDIDARALLERIMRSTDENDPQWRTLVVRCMTRAAERGFPIGLDAARERTGARRPQTGARRDKEDATGSEDAATGEDTGMLGSETHGSSSEDDGTASEDGDAAVDAGPSQRVWRAPTERDDTGDDLGVDLAQVSPSPRNRRFIADRARQALRAGDVTKATLPEFVRMLAKRYDPVTQENVTLPDDGSAAVARAGRRRAQMPSVAETPSEVERLGDGRLRRRDAAYEDVPAATSASRLDDDDDDADALVDDAASAMSAVPTSRARTLVASDVAVPARSTRGHAQTSASEDTDTDTESAAAVPVRRAQPADYSIHCRAMAVVRWARVPNDAVDNNLTSAIFVLLRGVAVRVRQLTPVPPDWPLICGVPTAKTTLEVLVEFAETLAAADKDTVSLPIGCMMDVLLCHVHKGKLAATRLATVLQPNTLLSWVLFTANRANIPDATWPPTTGNCMQTAVMCTGLRWTTAAPPAMSVDDWKRGDIAMPAFADVPVPMPERNMLSIPTVCVAVANAVLHCSPDWVDPGDVDRCMAHHDAILVPGDVARAASTCKMSDAVEMDDAPMHFDEQREAGVMTMHVDAVRPHGPLVWQKSLSSLPQRRVNRLIAARAYLLSGSYNDLRLLGDGK